MSALHSTPMAMYDIFRDMWMSYVNHLTVSRLKATSLTTGEGLSATDNVARPPTDIEPQETFLCRPHLDYHLLILMYGSAHLILRCERRPCNHCNVQFPKVGRDLVFSRRSRGPGPGCNLRALEEKQIKV